MKLALAENIRSFRKQRKMTQEQLAEVLGVTVGAVYKWESGLSVPELNLIMEMADFFDVSVDVLLGYRMKDNRLDSVADRLYACCRRMDPAAPAEAEKALGKYPHSFRIVLTCADVYLSYGMGSRDPGLLRRALELLEQARVLLPQNDNPRISETVIIGRIAAVYGCMGEREKALELMKQNNAGGCFSDEIGLSLAAFMNRQEEAVPFLSEGMVNGMSSLLSAAIGYLFVYRSREDWASALAVISLISNLVTELKTDGPAGYMDKTGAEVLLILAYARFRNGLAEEADEALRKAARLAVRFDSTPDFSLRSMRFLENTENTTAFDMLGTMAADSIRYLLELLDDRELSARWEEVYRSEQRASEEG